MSTGSVELEWGNGKASIQMVEKIATRESTGKFFGEGVKESVLVIARNSIEFAIQSKGLSASYHDPRCFSGRLLIMLSITE